MYFLNEIDVRPEFQRRGVGSALVKEFIRLAKASGAHEVWVLTNQGNSAAVNLYLGAGMKRPNRDDAVFAVELV